METILNLIWLLITIAAIWLWRFRWSVSRENRRYSLRMESIAMVCVLALLFPVISLTDDLHPETVAVDAASGKRNHCLLTAGHSQSGNLKSLLQAHAVYALLSHHSLAFVSNYGHINSAKITYETSFAAFTGLDRAPPSLA